MRVKSLSFSLIFTVMLFSQNASAALIYLPENSISDWQGTSYYDEEGFNIRIDFAVYDTFTHPDDFIWEGILEMPETDRYIYAYQVFNHPTADTEVTSFEILDIDKNPLDAYLMHSTTSQDDGHEGIQPNDSDTQGIWEFEWGTLIGGEASWFLIFSSSYAPVVGDYQVTSAPTSDDPLIPDPDSEVPEPTMVALFGLSGLMLSLKRKKSCK